MSGLKEYKEVLRAVLKGDIEQARVMGSRIGDVPWMESGALITGVCAILAAQRFPDRVSHPVLLEYVAEMMENYATADPPLQPVMCETAIRVALGETDLLHGIDVDNLTVHQIAFMNKVVADAEMTDRQIDEVLNEAEEVTRQLS